MEITPELIQGLQLSMDNLSKAIESQTFTMRIIGSSIIAGLGTFILSWWFSNRKYKTQEPVFDSHKAQNLYEAEKIEQLIAVCQNALGKYPNSAEAHWYLALAYFQQENFDFATEVFETLAEKHPNWRDSVDLYLDEIDNRNMEFNPLHPENPKLN